MNGVQVPLEHDEARRLMLQVRGHETQWPELAWFFAVPNGGHRSKRTAAAMKAEGAKPGVPDYLFPVARPGAVGLAIELKRLKGGRLEPEQKQWLDALAEQGWQVAVCRGWEQAWDVLRDYLASDAANDEETQA